MLIFIFILGLLIGSFLNVVIYRLPRGESIVFPASHCPECGHQLGALELIPVVSYLFLQGKCRACASKIAVTYPLIELTTALIFVLNYLYLENLTVLLAGLIFSSLLIALTVIDYQKQILPDKLTLGGLIVGLFLAFFRSDLAMGQAILGLLAGGGFLLILAYLSKGGIGGGDIKMMAMVGSFAGPVIAVTAIFLAAVLALLFALPGIFKGELQLKSKLPFGPFLAAASLLLWFWEDIFFHFYLNLFV